MKKKRIIAGAVAIGIVFAMSLQVVFSRTGPFTLNFTSSGSAGHPNISLSDGTRILCLQNGASAHSGYQYYQDDNDVDYFEGSMENKRKFWAYILAFGSYDGDDSIRSFYRNQGFSVSNDQAKQVAWAHGAAGVNATVDYLAEHGFMTLQNTPDGCKDANEIFKLISAYDTPEKAMGIMKIQKGPGEIDGQKLYDMMGLASMDAYHKYVKMEVVQAAGETEIFWDDYNGWMWRQTGTVVAGTTKTTPTIVKVTYDPAYFQVIKSEGSLRHYTCAVGGSQPMYQAKGKMEVSDCYFYITTGSGYKPPTTTTEKDETGGGDMGEVTAPEVKVYQHRETFLATYNAELKKLDYETGNPLKNSIWEVDEKFDKSQLSEDESENGIVEKFMREEPNTWEDWLVCTNDLTTDEEGHISHTDKRYYDFQQTYCNGHPLPPSDEDGEGEDGGDEGDDSAMEAWQEMVDECEAKAEESNGHMHHWLCNSEEEPSEEESFEKSGCKDARDATYENFINLKYSYTFREVKARDGYTLHFINGHVDDVPLEIMTTAASEAEKEAEWTECDNSDIVISGYRQNYIGEGASEMGSEGEKAEAEAYTIEVIEEQPKTTLQSLMSYLGFETATKENRYTITVIPRNSNEDFLEEETDSEMADEEDVSDYEISFDDEDVSDEIRIATESNAKQVSKIAKAIVGDTEFVHENENEVSYYGVRATSEDDEFEGEDPEDPEDPGDDSDEEKWDTGEEGGKFLDEGAIIDEQPKVEEGPHDKIFHVWIVYDHRTEGEIHFNKRDMDLKAKEDGTYSAFADANGDGSLEGAVYGLFAADPIYHPDTQRTGEEDEKGSGLIFDANDLVAVATTDRNGNGSFMVITEKPHSTYDYNTGKIVNSGKEYPKNLYDADTYRKEYEEEELGRVYENNLGNNGDYWIGRPLILGNYYIKELSRSEGYELSITGKEMAYTNRPNTSEGSDPKGSAWIKEQLHYANTLTGENEDYNSDNILTLTTASKGTTEGYNVVLDGLPESVTIKQVTHASVSKKVTVPNGGEWVNATEEPLYKTADGGYQAKEDQNGNKIPDPNAQTVPAAYSAYAAELKKVMNPGAALSASDTSRYTAAFVDSDTNFRYVKAEAESMLRQMNMETPKGTNYSTETVPVYDAKTGNVYGRPEVTLTI